MVIASGVLLVKVPAFPFSIWLPEAHVEASWPGSLALAAYALKFATLAVVGFLTRRLCEVDVVNFLLLFSVVFSIVCLGSSADVKKLIANLSILHMCATILILLGQSINKAHFLVNFSWHHHSIVTGSIFLMVGFTYAVSGSRILRFHAQNTSNMPVLATLFLTLLTFSLDLPWTPNVFVEISFVKIVATSVPVVAIFLISYFWIVVAAYLKIFATSSVSRSGSTAMSSHGVTSDLPSTTILAITAPLLALLLIGFGLRWHIFSSLPEHRT